MTTSQPLDLMTIKGRQQRAWSSGDYGKVGVTLLAIGELLSEAVDLRPRQRVLDVACGNGNASLAAARRFCEVVGIDYVPALLEEGNGRKPRVCGLSSARATPRTSPSRTPPSTWCSQPSA
jgi:2-polyprenyl-3-methyl-5-hydroxy-6-metoxy-1,4-benzoquinol methylase